jgi:endonuclease/exonuclease/phosphatase family metal-dependent hydrolase
MVNSGRSSGRMFRWTAVFLAFAYPLALVLVILALRFVGERWWAAVAVMYLPRLGFAIPLPFVLLAVWRWAPRWLLALQVVSIYLLIVPLMGFSIALRTPGSPGGRTVRIVSYNIGKAGSRLPGAIAQMQEFSPDIVVVQAMEPREEAALKAAFSGWHLNAESQFLMASRFPIVEVNVPPPLQYAAGTGGAHFVRYTLDTPVGPVDLFNVHTTSPREGLDALRRGGVLTALVSGRTFDPKATGFVEFNAYRRQRQIAGLAEAARASRNAVIIAGDTNLPWLSRIFGEHLSSFRDGFEEAGRGFGYTFPASHPWMRIDRILTNGRLRPLDFRVGSTVAAEHLCVFAEIGADR